MQIYLVGGAVRDALLGLPVQDRDWVVVGSTPEELIALGYLPVGKDFPVFLHPDTKEEYALARTERKTARGYHGFEVHAAPDVTLEEDLARRDLTINSIAAHAHKQGFSGTFEGNFEPFEALIDPFGGQTDLKAKVLRHVTAAFREDPVRILRVARFAARFADFSVAPETMHLMQAMVRDGEADALVAERVWQELARGLMEKKPSRMFEVLRACGALQKLLPEIKLGSDSNLILDTAAQLDAPLPVRFACLMHRKLESDPNLIKSVCERLRVPVDCKEMADVVAREHGNIHRSAGFDAAALTRLLERCDAFRKPQRFADVLLACECIYRGEERGSLGLEDAAYPQRIRLVGVLTAAQSVVTHLIAEQAQRDGHDGKKIGELIHAARVRAVEAAQV
jgi:tRNA nucleotidyltransferase (CCA-adding enzyme)